MEEEEEEGGVVGKGKLAGIEWVPETERGYKGKDL
jgi:hypothetical protein